MVRARGPRSERREGATVAALVLVVAYLLLGIGLLVSNGTLSGLPYGLASAVLLVVALRRDPPPRLERILLPYALATCTVLTLLRGPAGGPGMWFLLPATILLGLVGLLGCAGVAGVRWAWPGRARGLGLALALYALAGGFVVAKTAAPTIDVLEIEQLGARALESGRNPYAGAYPNPYTPADTRAFFGDDRTELHEYPYPPLSLVATAIGHAVGGDARWTLLAAQLGIAWLLFALARGAGHDPGVAVGLAVLHLVHPRGLFVLEQGWTDSMAAFALLGVLLALQRGRSRWLAATIGGFLAIKQYSVLAIALLARNGRVRRRAWVEGVAAAVAVTLPFFVWGPHDFVNDVLLFQLRQPFRLDAMSVPAFVASVSGWKAPGAGALVGAGAGLAAGWGRVGHDSPPSRLPLALAAMYAGFFLFAKQAFCNYYYFVSVLVLAAAALVEPPMAPLPVRLEGSAPPRAG
jgi:hypothetical protein